MPWAPPEVKATGAGWVPPEAAAWKPPEVAAAPQQEISLRDPAYADLSRPSTTEFAPAIEGIPTKESGRVGGAYSEAWRTANTPLVEVIPKVSDEELKTMRNTKSTGLQVASGVQRGTADLLNSFTSPLGIATLGLGVVPKAVGKAIAGAFALHMASQTPEIARQLGAEFGKPEDQRDPAKIAEMITAGAGNTAFAALAGAHAMPESARMSAIKELSRQLETGDMKAATPDEIARTQPIGIRPEPLETDNAAPPPQAPTATGVPDAALPVAAAPKAEAGTPGQENIDLASELIALKDALEQNQISPVATALPENGANAGGTSTVAARPEVSAATPVVEAQAAPPGALAVDESFKPNAEPKTDTIPAPVVEAPAAGDLPPIPKGDQYKAQQKLAQENTVEQLTAWRDQARAKAEAAKAAHDADKTNMELAQAKADAGYGSQFFNEALKFKQAEAGQPIAQDFSIGAARPAEFEPPKQFKTSNKNATVDAERKARGLPPMMESARRSNQSAWDEAMATIDERPEAQDSLINELANNPRAVTPTENAMLLHRRIDLRNEYEKALKRWREAFESDEVGRAGEESYRVRELSSKLSDLEDITKATGRESGLSLQARKMMAREDFSLAQMEVRKMEALGRNLTHDEQLQLLKAHERIAELERQLEQREAGKSTRELEAATDEAIKETARQARKVKPKDAEAQKDADIERIRDRVDKGEAKTVTPLLQKLARYFWNKGIQQREPMIDALHGALKDAEIDLTREEVQRAFSGYGDYTQLSKGEADIGLRDLRGQVQQVLKLKALVERKPLEKTGVERRVPSDEERRLIQQVNELKRKLGVVVTDPATQLKSALQARKTYYEHRISDLKAEIAAKERAVKTKTPSPSDTELDALRAEYARVKAEHDSIFGGRELTNEQRLKMAIASAERNQAEWTKKLEDAKRGVFGAKPEGTKVSSTELEAIKARTEALKDEVAALKATDAGLLSERRAESIRKQKEALEKEIAEREARLSSGDIVAEKKLPNQNRPADPELEPLLQRRAELARQLAEARKGSEAIALSHLKERLTRRIADYQDRKARGDFERPERKLPPRDAASDSLRVDLETAKREFQDALELDRWNKSSIFQKTGRTAANIYDAARLLMTTGEFSFILRQGKLAALSRPIQTAKAIWPAIQAMRSDHAQHVLDLAIHDHPLFPEAQQAKLAITERGSSLSKAEEITMGRWGVKIPVVRAFNRAAETFLNKVRFDTWLALRKSLTKSGTPTPMEDRQIAMFINEATGRGGLGKLEAAAVPLARVMFSPRYFASRLQIAAGHSLWGGTPRTRRLIATEYARILVGMGIYYTLLMSYFNRGDRDKAEIGTDPRSSDFGKIRIGDTRLDPLAGLGQVITFAARTATGETTTLGGKTVPIRGEKLPFGSSKWTDVAARFGRSKLHPVPGAIANLFDGTDLAGNPVTPLGEVGNMVAPITYIDIYKALKEQDLDDGTALALLAVLGEGLQTYNKDNKHKATAP